MSLIINSVADMHFVIKTGYETITIIQYMYCMFWL